mmetsp:Transcript_2903/g.5502  ORF Transcript_2903/g.5502 Transcript_2903/m.5502 type:complete len:470 (+) Transcript_2903:3030-4439(+)
MDPLMEFGSSRNRVKGAEGSVSSIQRASDLAAPADAEFWGQSSWVNFVACTASFTLNNVAGPYAFQTSGWVIGSIFFVYSAVATYYTAFLLGKQSVPLGANATYPNVVAAAFKKFGYYFAMSMQALAYFVTVPVLQITCAQVLSLTLRHDENSPCVGSLIAIGALIQLVLVQAPTFRWVTPIACISLLVTVLRQVLVYVQMARYDMFSNCHASYDTPSGENGQGYNIFISLGTMAFMFGGHGFIPEQLREMRNAEKLYVRAVNWTYFIIVVFYLSMMIPAYYVWGSWTSPILVDNLPDDSVSTAVMYLTYVWGVTEMVVPTYVLSLGIETVCFKMSPHIHLNSKDTTGWLGIHPFVWRVLNRSFIVGLELFFALLLQDGGINNIQALVGALGFGALTYWLPCLVELVNCTHYRAVNAVLTLCGLTITVGGIYTAAVGISQESGATLFGAGTCQRIQMLNVSQGPCIYSL